MTKGALAASGLAVTLLLLKLKRGEKSDLGSPRKASRRSWSGLLGGSAEAPEEPSEQLLAALPELLDALRRLPQSLDDVRELMELLKTTQELSQDPEWLQRRDEPVTDLASWLYDGATILKPQAMVELSSRRQVFIGKLEELHDLKWDVPFDAEEEAIHQNKIARDAAGME
ncbi:unnamed protein product [Durusdinium trenchii]|uniref:Uncharacterized protein n=1 Tax=Durusdinium trenchii TaxID=1381693 RepID=A0ABP0KJX2_9DINO